jgi:radical SAM protein with 4Fe4S-binding SPASM domain
MRSKYIKYLSINKIANLLKLFVSYLVSVLISRPIHCGMPASIAIEPTNRCNLKCPECPTGNESLIRIKSESDINLYHKLIDETGKYLLSIIFYFQGEPFLNPDLFEMINYASQKGIYTITSTNGHFLNQKNSEKIIKSGLDKLIISLDGISPEIYQIYRQGGNLNKVIEGIKTIVAAKKQLKSKTPKIVIQFLVFKSNQHQIEDAKIFAKVLGVDKIVFKTAQIYNFKNGNPQIPDISKYSRYKKNEDGTYSIKSKLKNRCWRMWSNPVITASGEIAVCCFDKNAEFGIGNISKASFQNIWKSKEYDKFRKKIFTNRKAINICTNCTEGLKKVIS